MYRGDIRLGDTIDLKFTTRSFSTGAPTTLAGTPSIAAYPGNSTTEITAGITLTVDFDTRTGLHNVRVVATSGNGYVTATNYDLVITAGTVGGVSVVGEVIGSFSIEARSAVMPTTAGRTLDVSAGGEAGIDWANVGTPGSTVSLSATTVSTVTTATTATNVTTVNGLAANTITAASIAAAALNGKGDWNIGKTGYSLSSAGIQAIWDALTSALTTVGSVGKLLVDNINATISSRLASASYTAPLDAAGTRTAVGLASANLDTQLSGINSKTTNLPASPAATSDIPTAAVVADAVWDEPISGHLTAGSTGNALNAAGSAGDPWSTPLPGAYGAGTAGKIIGDNLNATVGSRLASSSYSAPLDAAAMRAAVGLATANLDTQLAALPTATQNADALLNRDMSAVSDTNARSPLNAFRFIRNKWSVSGTTLTVTKENDTTTAWTATLTATPGADPVTGADPA